MKTKTKLTIAVASVLSVATLAGTGYAGWVLSHNVEGNANGNMTAYGVADKTVKLTIGEFDSPKGIVWGKETKSADHSWFGFTEVDNQFFNPALNFTVENTDKTDSAEPLIESAKITVIDKDAAYKTCIEEGLIKGPQSADSAGNYVADIKIGLVLQPKGEQVNVFSYKLNLWSADKTELFGWGTVFAGKNPVNYYNQYSAEDTISEDSETTWFQHAKEKMEKIAKLDKISFRIDLTVNHASL